MLIRGEALIDTVTMAFTISGKRGEWRVTVTGPGNITTEDETVEATWYPLFTEMLRAAFEGANRRRFPARHSEAVR
jgi:hypothetical protein